MHDQPNRDPIAADRSLQHALMAHLLVNYPTQFSADEYLLDLGQPNPREAAPALEDAITALAGAGVIHRNGELLVATWTAKYIDDLNDGR